MQIFSLIQKRLLVKWRFVFYDDRGNWIYPPKSFTILGGDDNNNLTEIPCKVTINEMGNISKAFIQFKQPVDVSVLQVNIKRFGIIPDGEKGAGHEAWLFCDEILLR
jgi:hexosaminidase